MSHCYSCRRSGLVTAAGTRTVPFLLRRNRPSNQVVRGVDSGRVSREDWEQKAEERVVPVCVGRVVPRPTVESVLRGEVPNAMVMRLARRRLNVMYAVMKSGTLCELRIPKIAWDTPADPAPRHHDDPFINTKTNGARYDGSPQTSLPMRCSCRRPWSGRIALPVTISENGLSPPWATHPPSAATRRAHR